MRTRRTAGNPSLTGISPDAWDARLFEDLLSGGELLCVDVLGTQFAVRWGRSVTEEQQQSMRSAWARCAGAGAPLIPPLPKEPTESLPFSASVSYLSQRTTAARSPCRPPPLRSWPRTSPPGSRSPPSWRTPAELMMLHACGVASPETGGRGGARGQVRNGQNHGSLGAGRDVRVRLGRNRGHRAGRLGGSLPQAAVREAGARCSPSARWARTNSGFSRRRPNRSSSPSCCWTGLTGQRGTDGTQDRPEAPVLRQLPLADGLLALVPDSSSQAEIDEPLQSLCRLIDRVGGVWQVTYSEAADLPEALEPLFRKRRRSKPEWEARLAEAVSGDHPGRVDPPGRTEGCRGCRRRPAGDAGRGDRAAERDRAGHLGGRSHGGPAGPAGRRSRQPCTAGRKATGPPSPQPWDSSSPNQFWNRAATSRQPRGGPLEAETRHRGPG